jgi:two-component system nitrate/nitrite response regulator NarL
MSIMHLAHAVARHEAPSQIRVLVVSGVRLIREGLVRGLRRRHAADVALVGCASVPEIEQARISELRPDVILVDLSHHEGIVAAKTLRSLSPASKLIAFSVVDTVEDVVSCAAAGFSGYVPREAGVDDVLRAVRAARDGQMACSPHIAAAMFNQLADRLSLPKATNGASVLTARERQVLSLSDEGWSNKEIGRRLEISPSTVKNHIHSILQKLKVERRSQAAALMRGEGGADG